jgi:hypothetical protein
MTLFPFGLARAMMRALVRTGAGEFVETRPGRRHAA